MKRTVGVKNKKAGRGTHHWRRAAVAILLGFGLFAILSRPTPQKRQSQPATEAGNVPPYYESVQAAKPFPQLLPAAYFSDRPLVARAYRAAAEIPGVAAQQPCYCHCDVYGHKSLLDCYASDHAAG